MIQNRDLIDRFIRYAKINTQSKEEVPEQPSTERQRNLADVLCRELEEMGAEVRYDREFCYLYASLPGTEPALGFVAHMDTSPDAEGENVLPRIVENYDGQPVRLGTAEPPVWLDPLDFPELAEHAGEDLIVTDGRTLLGADDKAGVAEIMNLFAFYAAHPEIPHRKLCLAFTPDEEVGRGTEHFDTELFGAKEAYTVDGGMLGGMEYECFHAASAVVEIQGKSIHPGTAKGKMINASALAVEFHGMLPPAEVPEHTEGYEGFFHLTEITGCCEHAVLRYIIRDHDRAKWEKRKETFRQITAYMNEKYGGDIFRLRLKDQYHNMAEHLKDHMDLIRNAEAVMRSLGVTPRILPIRGGTDGAALTFRGIPCPNLCTGGYNFHGRFEYASIQEMESCAEILIRLAALS